jgi:hypothetical protein
MKASSSSARGRRTKAFGLIVVTGLLSGLLSPVTAPAEEPARTATTREPTAVERETWRKEMLATPKPKNGCFSAGYPEKQWREVPCTTPPDKPYPPSRGGMSRIGPAVVGNGSDNSAKVAGSPLDLAEGSFDSVSVESECNAPCSPPDYVCPSNPTCTSTNDYSLQLNTQPFSGTVACQNSPNPTTCQGWEQFVYDSSGYGFIQYWLLNYGPAGPTSCPMPRSANCAPNKVASDGWCPFGSSDCVVNATVSVAPPSEPITSLGQLKVMGARAGTPFTSPETDSITVADGDTVYSAPGNNYFPDLGSLWQEAEFNVLGASESQAVFTGPAGSFPTTIVVRIVTNVGTPTCDPRGFTGETNNLILVPNSCNSFPPILGSSQSTPAIVFTESSSLPPPPPVCRASCNTGGRLAGSLGTPCGEVCPGLQCGGCNAALTCTNDQCRPRNECPCGGVFPKCTICQ